MADCWVTTKRRRPPIVGICFNFINFIFFTIFLHHFVPFVDFYFLHKNSLFFVQIYFRPKILHLVDIVGQLLLLLLMVVTAVTIVCSWSQLSRMVVDDSVRCSMAFAGFHCPKQCRLLAGRQIVLVDSFGRNSMARNKKMLF